MVEKIPLTERNIKNNTEEEWEEEVQIFSKKIKENKKKGGRKFKNQFFLIGILSMQSWTAIHALWGMELQGKEAQKD